MIFEAKRKVEHSSPGHPVNLSFTFPLHPLHRPHGPGPVVVSVTDCRKLKLANLARFPPSSARGSRRGKWFQRTGLFGRKLGPSLAPSPFPRLTELGSAPSYLLFPFVILGRLGIGIALLGWNGTWPRLWGSSMGGIGCSFYRGLH